MKKTLVLAWFAVCLFFFGIVLHPLDLQRALPSMKEGIQEIHQVVRPLFFRAIII